MLKCSESMDISLIPMVKGWEKEPLHTETVT